MDACDGVFPNNVVRSVAATPQEKKEFEEERRLFYVGMTRAKNDLHIFTFSKNTSCFVKEIQPQDLIKYGLIPEFVGRLPIVVGLDELTEDALVKIMTEPKNSLVKQYNTMFKLDGVDLEIKPEAIREVAKKSMKLKTGARGLRTIMEDVMLDIMFVTPDDRTISKVIVTKDTVENKTPIIERKEIKTEEKSA